MSIDYYNYYSINVVIRGIFFMINEGDTNHQFFSKLDMVLVVS